GQKAAPGRCFAWQALVEDGLRSSLARREGAEDAGLGEPTGGNPGQRAGDDRTGKRGEGDVGQLVDCFVGDVPAPRQEGIVETAEEAGARACEECSGKVEFLVPERSEDEFRAQSLEDAGDEDGCAVLGTHDEFTGGGDGFAEQGCARLADDEYAQDGGDHPATGNQTGERRIRGVHGDGYDCGALGPGPEDHAAGDGNQSCHHDVYNTPVITGLLHACRGHFSASWGTRRESAARS